MPRLGVSELDCETYDKYGAFQDENKISSISELCGSWNNYFRDPLSIDVIYLYL